ncbi:unnamed protein product [Coffea canephora]|uniref:Histidine kinase/HSP90-like ATPase domain-containing protein n=1 Tax=Coffea canephora TaxID=49390 RepID=A0A068UYD5_COFCA|nr:unnamed protein product [Coffea canephora]
MLSAIPYPPLPQTTTALFNPPNLPCQTTSNLLSIPAAPNNNPSSLCRATAAQRPPSLPVGSSSAPPLRPVTTTATTYSPADDDNDDSNSVGVGEEANQDMVASANAVAAIIKKVSTSPVEFVQRIEKAGGSSHGGGLVLPSVDFQRLCLEQLALFRRIVHSDALLSIYVRPAGSYVMDRLELRRITFHPLVNATADIVILVGDFRIPAGLRVAEAALSSRTAEFFPELRSVVFPMVKHPFVVGFLVAEFPQMILGGEPTPSTGESCYLPNSEDSKLLELQTYDKGQSNEILYFTTEQRLNAENISRSITMAYVMDQKAILLQHSSWQNNVRMSSLVEQIRGSLSSIQTLSKMLSVHMRRSEISFDIVQDILVQGDHIKDVLQQLQDAVYLTKANIIHNNGGLKKMHAPTYGASNSINETLESYEALSLNSTPKDSEIPMPPLALAPLKQKAVRRPCNVSDVLNDLVAGVEHLAHMQQRYLKVSELSRPLQVAVEEPALRQALSNLIEGSLLRTQVGGKVEIVCTGAPAGGALIIIDDDGPDMHYMTQMHSLTPFGMDLFSDDKVEDNMTWNFIAGLTVAREILETYGCVVRVISPRTSDASIGAGGTRVELWLPYVTSPDADAVDRVI